MVLLQVKGPIELKLTKRGLIPSVWTQVLVSTRVGLVAIYMSGSGEVYLWCSSTERALGTIREEKEFLPAFYCRDMT